MSDELEVSDERLKRFIRELLMMTDTQVIGDCLSDDDCVACVTDVSPVRRSDDIEQHIATCARCAARLSTMCEEANDFLAVSNAGRRNELRRRLQRSWSEVAASFSRASTTAATPKITDRAAYGAAASDTPTLLSWV